MDNWEGTKIKMIGQMGEGTKVVITGARIPVEYSDFKERVLKALPKPPFQLITFQSFGLDELTQKFAMENRFPLYFYSLKWDKFGRSGGYIRNMEIIDLLENFPKSEIIFVKSGESLDLLDNLKRICVKKNIKIKDV